MTNPRSLKIALIVLIMLNISTFVFFIFIAPHPHFGGPKDIIIEKLQLDDAQIKAYEDLITQHQTKIRETEERIAAARNELYTLLNKEEQQSESAVIIAKISSIQSEIELIHFQHFSDLKAICHADQLEYFSNLTKDMEKLFNKHR